MSERQSGRKPQYGEPVYSVNDLDPIVHRLLRIRGIGPAKVFVLALFVYLIIPVLWVNSAGHLFNQTDTTGQIVLGGFLAPDNSYLFFLPILLAVIFTYYFEACDTIQKLCNRGVLYITREPEEGSESVSAQAHESDPGDVVGCLVDVVRATWWSRVLRWFLIGIGISIPVIFLINGTFLSERVTWLFSKDGPRPTAFYFVTVLHGAGLYIIFGWVINHLRASYLLKTIFDQTTLPNMRVRLNVLHPDGCMGLGPVSDLTKAATLGLIGVSFVIFG